MTSSINCKVGVRQGWALFFVACSSVECRLILKTIWGTRLWPLIYWCMLMISCWCLQVKKGLRKHLRSLEELYLAIFAPQRSLAKISTHWSLLHWSYLMQRYCQYLSYDCELWRHVLDSELEATEMQIQFKLATKCNKHGRTWKAWTTTPSSPVERKDIELLE